MGSFQISSWRAAVIERVIDGVTGVVERLSEAHEQIKEGAANIASEIDAWRVQSKFKREHSQTDVQRFVYDAEGWDRLPPIARLVRKEGDAPTGIEDVDTVYDNMDLAAQFFREELGIITQQPMRAVVNYNDERFQHGLRNSMMGLFYVGGGVFLFGAGDNQLFKSQALSFTNLVHEMYHKILKEQHGGLAHSSQAYTIEEHLCDAISVCADAWKRKQVAPYPDGIFRLASEVMVDPTLCINDMLNPGTAYHHVELGKDPEVAHMRHFVIGDDDDEKASYSNRGILNRAIALFSLATGEPLWGAPLKILRLAEKEVIKDLTFTGYTKALMSAAAKYDSLHGTNHLPKMSKALKKVGLLDYVVSGKEVVRIKH